MTEQHVALAIRASRKRKNEANGYRPQISCHHEVNVGLIRTSLCKTNPILGHRRQDVEGGPGRVRKESGPRVMAVLRSLNIDLCTFSGKASLAAANRHDMCNLEKLVEPVSIPNRERNDPNSGVGGTLTNDTTLVLYGIHPLYAVSRRSLEEGPDIAK
jgi:hypothetical protein